jgi:phenylalanyl-tRNA synthetase beta chain
VLVYKEWLEEYVDVPLDMDDFKERMIMSGSNIETAKFYGVGIEKAVTGRILSVEKHKDADRLFVCMVDAGGEAPIKIVTGAENVHVGANVPIILEGGRLPDGRIIKKGKIRGVESSGMLCSAKEFGYEDKAIPASHRDGIWILSEDCDPGSNVVEALELKGEVIDFEITPNRPDCLSMTGMAREAAAVFGGALIMPDNRCVRECICEGKSISVEIKRPDLCARYVARIIKDVKIAESPWWLQKRLMYSGMRPINNIVDITNYVMLEYGQPIHAFDIRQIKGSKIIVDTADEGEKFTTLDGTTRVLSENMLMIKDNERPVAIAGVMGGLNSEIEADTNTIVVESANFRSDSVRSTSKALGLRTEASSRFEKGIDPNLAAEAADRVCYLAELLGAGTVIAGSVDVYPSPGLTKTISVRVDRINRILGITLSQNEMVSIFTSLGMTAEPCEKMMIKVTPPSVRMDVASEEDCAEEIARMYGYDRLPLTIPKGNSRFKKSQIHIVRDIAREALTGMGLYEIQTYSFSSPKGTEKIVRQKDSPYRDFITLMNPLGEENSVMRTMLTPHMLETLERNISRGIKAARAFELGNTFLNIADEKGLPKEQESLCIGFYGDGESFHTLKGSINELFVKLGLDDMKYLAFHESDTYHPGKCALMSTSSGAKLGMMGELHPDVMELYDFEQKIYCLELNFGLLSKQAKLSRYYSPLPRYPAIDRDIALILDENVKAADVENIIRIEAKKLLKNVNLFDVYRGKQIPDGKKSVAFSLTYRSDDRTLTDEEVTPVHNRVLEQLKKQLGAELRKT